MARICFLFSQVSIGLLLLGVNPFHASAGKIPTPEQINKNLIAARVSWILNQGQQPGEVAYYAKTFSGSVFITKQEELVYSICQNKDKAWSFSESFINANKQPVEAENPSVTRVSDFSGNNPSSWRGGLPTFGTISLGELWQGITVKINAYGNNIEKLFNLDPGVSPQQIEIQIDRISRLRITRRGELLVKSAEGVIHFTKPVAFQLIEGVKVNVPVSYILKGKNRYGFELGKHDSRFTVCIDPLIASTFLGGSIHDRVNAVCMDTSGNIYVTGETNSLDFPFTHLLVDTTKYPTKPRDIFISKLNGDLSTLIASVYIGGVASDISVAIALDKAGNIFIAGRTLSNNFPITGTPYDSLFGSLNDVVVCKLSADLSQLLASTYLGAYENDYAFSMAIDYAGNIFVTGFTEGVTYPTTTKTYDSTFNYGFRDVFVSKLSNDLSTLLGSTYLGGTRREVPSSITTDASGNVFVSGTTQSRDFPTAGNPFDDSYNGDFSFSTTDDYREDIFISKFSNDLTILLASTFFGGDSIDRSNDIIADVAGNILITGETNSPDFPMAGHPYDSLIGIGGKPFIARLNNTLSSLLASTFLGKPHGGFGFFGGSAIASDPKGNVYVTGYTYYPNLPLAGHVYDTSFNGAMDVFVAAFDHDLSSLTNSTYIGGPYYDIPYGLVLDRNGDMIIAGEAQLGFPSTPGAYDTSNVSIGIFLSDGFVLRFNFDPIYTIKPLHDIRFCLYDSVLLKAEKEGASYTWSNGSHDRDIWIRDSGLFICQTFKGDSIWIDSMRVIVSFPPHTNHHDVLCLGSTKQLTATGSAPTTWIWNTQDTLKTITISDSGIYVVVITDTAVCSTYDSFYVAGLKPPSNLMYDTLCTGDQKTLKASGSQIASWKWNTHDTTRQIVVSDSGLYTAIVMDTAVCSTYDSFYLAVQNPVPLGLVSDTLICEGSTITINARRSAYDSYVWNTGAKDSAILINSAGLFTVIATNGICTVNDSVKVEVLPTPVLSLPSDTPACFRDLQSIILDAGDWKSYHWYPTGEYVRSIFATYPEVYIVVVTDNHDCIGTDTTLVEETCPDDIYIPNGFTPNRDGVNDVFMVRGIGVRNMDLSILNRWGQQVFHSTDLSSGWDGTFNNAPCASDAYVYILKYQLSSDKSLKEKKGTVTLIR